MDVYVDAYMYIRKSTPRYARVYTYIGISTMYACKYISMCTRSTSDRLRPLPPAQYSRSYLRAVGTLVGTVDDPTRAV